MAYQPFRISRGTGFFGAKILVAAVKNNTTPSQNNLIADLYARINTSRKYRRLGLPIETMSDLVEKATQAQADPREVERVVRQKLHNLVAPYLGDPNYEAMSEALASLPNDSGTPEIQEWCRQALAAHASTRERMPVIEKFYQQLFELTGPPRTLLDLACGLNPFSLPWMGLPPDSHYLAYDLHLPRVDLINDFFNHVHQSGAAAHQDILVQPPQVEVDVTLFFKEAHRFEQRERGANREFFRRIKTRWLLVSLPTVSLSGHRSMLEGDRRLVYDACSNEDWAISEIFFDTELVFCIRKQP